MKLEEFKKDYYDFTEKVSTNVRQYSFAGIGIIWLFKINEPNAISLSTDLVWSLLFLCLTLLFDLLQYLIPSILLDFFYRKHEKLGAKSDKEVTIYWWQPWPGRIFYFLKLISVIIAYSLILNYFYRILKST